LFVNVVFEVYGLPLKLYVYGGKPPLPLTDIELFPPLHSIGVVLVTKITGAGGNTILNVTVDVQPFTSVAVIVYIPAVNELNVPGTTCIPTFGEIVYVLLPVPPTADTTAMPFKLQVGFAVFTIDRLTAVAGSVIVNIVCVEHAFASVATTVYVPAPVANGLTWVVPLTVYVITPVPPVALNVKLPFAELQSALVEEAVNTTVEGCVITTTVEEVQLLASVAINV
jgi:hypothetical protein